MSYFPIFWDIETTGLNPMIEPWSNMGRTSQVTAIGFGCIDNWHEAPDRQSADITVKCLYDSDEYRLLSNFQDRLTDLVGEGEPIIIGYNSRVYDHPYYNARCGRLRLDPEPLASQWKRLDMMRVAGSDPAVPKTYPKEGEYADALGIEVEDPYDGSDMPEAFANKNWDKIKTHVLADVKESILMFLERKDRMMDHFYDHYDINASGAPVPEVEVDD